MRSQAEHSRYAGYSDLVYRIFDVYSNPKACLLLSLKPRHKRPIYSVSNMEMHFRKEGGTTSGGTALTCFHVAAYTSSAFVSRSVPIGGANSGPRA
jgi:hypothetical protein